MVWSDSRIRDALESHELIIDPLLDKEAQIAGIKVDLRLDNQFQILRDQFSKQPFSLLQASDPRRSHESCVIPYHQEFVLNPGRFALGQSFETLVLPDQVMAVFDGRSSLARRGILVHITAGTVDPGFSGVICFELYNVGHEPVALHPLMRIGSVTFHDAVGKVKTPYRGKFGGSAHSQLGLTARDKDGEAINQTTKRF